MQHTLSLSGRSRILFYVASLGLPSLLLLVVLVQPVYEPKWMFLDSLTAAQLSGDCCHTYYGFMSNVGIMLWVATSAALLLAAAVLFGVSAMGVEFRFALFGGLLSGWLALDDMFLLHELVLPTLGVPQLVVIAIYVALALAYLLLSFRILLRAEYWVLLIGGAGLALSIFVDSFFHSLLPQLVYIEDSAKFVGIFCWFSFHFLTATRVLSIQIADIK